MGAIEKESSLLWRYRGFLFTFVSSLTFSISSLLIKYLKNINPVTVALWRFQGSFLPAIPIVLVHFIFNRKTPQDSNIESKPRGKDYAFVLLRSILACNSLVLHFYSLKFLQVGDALVIFSSTPIFAYALAHFILKEPCGLTPALTSLVTLIGVVIVIKPPFLTGAQNYDMEMVKGAGLALTSMLLSTLSYIALRYVRRVHYSLTMLTFGGWCTVETLTLSLALGVFGLPQGPEEWVLAIGLAMVTFFGEIAIILALKAEQTGPFALIRSLDVVFGFCGQLLIWHAVPDLYSLVGAGIVVLAVIFAAMLKYLHGLPEGDLLRKKLRFLLK